MITTIIFDMDGVISDTLDQHVEIESQILKEHGINMSKEQIIEKYNGKPARVLFAEQLNIEDVSHLIDDKLKIMMQRPVKPMKGVIEFINSLDGFKKGVASSSPKRYVDYVIDYLKLRKKFGAITGVEEVKEGKPSPDLFLLTAKKLGVKPEECLVIEDAVAGMMAAKKAGMKCIAFVNDDKIYPADLKVRELSSLNIQIIRNL